MPRLPVEIITGNKHSRTQQSSSPREFHPQALTEPDVTVSRHPALIVQPFNAEVSSEQASRDVA